jgi:hypothetical protein
MNCEDERETAVPAGGVVDFQDGGQDEGVTSNAPSPEVSIAETMHEAYFEDVNTPDRDSARGLSSK